MWTCIRCKADLDADQAPPDVDDFGLHFMCPECGRRNRLRTLPDDGDGMRLQQIDEPESGA